MKSSEDVGALKDLFEKRCRLRDRIKDTEEDMQELVSQMSLQSISSFFDSVYVYPVWEKGDLSVVLLVNKAKLAGCGILIWGCQFENNYECLALKVHEFEAKFMVFDGQPGSYDFAMLNGNGPEEKEKMFSNLRKICTREKVSYVFVRNAEVFMDRVKICPGKEFKDITDFYILIARSSKELIPEFSFINPENSSAFWSNNG